jgi:hypothetical protein
MFGWLFGTRDPLLRLSRSTDHGALVEALGRADVIVLCRGVMMVSCCRPRSRPGAIDRDDAQSEIEGAATCGPRQAPNTHDAVTP